MLVQVLACEETGDDNDNGVDEKRRRDCRRNNTGDADADGLLLCFVLCCWR